jgi:hypothetical protein
MTTLRALALAVVALALVASPVLAAAPSAGAPVFGGYWSGFVDHWGEAFQKQNGIILIALGVGAVSLVIITRGKWLK